jgi:hypothetical protein
MVKVMRRVRGLCLASVRDLSGKRAWCTQTAHVSGDHTANGMSWGNPRNGILKITHED